MTILLQETEDFRQLPVVGKLYLVYEASADDTSMGLADTCDSLLLL